MVKHKYNQHWEAGDEAYAHTPPRDSHTMHISYKSVLFTPKFGSAEK